MQYLEYTFTFKKILVVYLTFTFTWNLVFYLATTPGNSEQLGAMCLRLSAQRHEGEEYLSPGSHPHWLKFAGVGWGTSGSRKQISNAAEARCPPATLHTAGCCGNSQQKCEPL